MDYNTLRNHVGTACIPFWILHPPTSFHPLNSGGIVVFDIRHEICFTLIALVHTLNFINGNNLTETLAIKICAKLLVASECMHNLGTITVPIALNKNGVVSFVAFVTYELFSEGSRIFFCWIKHIGSSASRVKAQICEFDEFGCSK